MHEPPPERHGDLPPAPPPISMDHSASGPPAHEYDIEHPRIEGYKFVRLVGQGGMGTVWEAWQLSTGRRVAVKMLRGSAFESHRSRNRFQREIEILARLSHPHIAQLYDSSFNKYVAYYVMEFVDGLPIDEYCVQHHLGPREILSLCLKVCQAMDYAQRSGVIHRDLKPSNILVDATGKPRVLDFGLAKSLEPDASQMTVSIEGGLTGTLAYMAPEQATGRPDEIGSTADVYSLGVVLFQLLTGRLPHAPGESTYEFQHRLVETDAPSCRSVKPQLDKEIEALISKALTRNPQQRYASAGELARDIDNYLKGNPLNARPLTFTYLLRRRIAQHRAAFLVGVGVTLICLSVLSYSYWQTNQARQLAEQREVERSQALYASRLREANHAYEANDIARAKALLAACDPRYRHWEWRYLSGLVDQSQWTFHLPTYPKAIAMRSDGPAAYALDRNGVLYRWAPGMKQPQARRLTPDKPDKVALDNSASHAALAQTGAIVVINLDDNKRTTIKLDDGVTVNQLKLSPHGHRVAAALSDNHVVVWNTANGAVEQKQTATSLVKSLTVSEKLLAFLDQDGGHLWEAQATERRFPNPPGPVSTSPLLEWSGPLQTLMLATSSGDLQALTRTPTGVVQHVADLGYPISDVCADPSAQQWAVATGAEIHLLPSELQHGITRLRGHPEAIDLIRFDPDGSCLVSAAGNEIKIWRLKSLHSSHLQIRPQFDAESVTARYFTQNGGVLAFGTASGHLLTYSTPNNAILREDHVAGSVFAIAFPSDVSGELVTFAQYAKKYVLQRATERINTDLEFGAPAGITPLSPNGQYFAARSNRDAISCKIFDTLSKQLQWVAQGDCSSIAWSDDSRMFAAIPSSPISTLDIWRTSDWTTLCQIPLSKQSAPYLLAFSADGQTLAILTHDSIEVWSLKEPRRLGEVPAQSLGFIQRMAVSTDGSRIATGADNDIAIIDIATKETLLHLSTGEKNQSLAILQFSLDANKIISANIDGTINIWFADPEP